MAAILIPVYMVVVYLIVGNPVVNEHSPVETILVILNSLALGLQSGFLEEILLDGIKLLQSLLLHFSLALCIFLICHLFL